MCAHDAQGMSKHVLLADWIIAYTRPYKYTVVSCHMLLFKVGGDILCMYDAPA